MRLKQHREDVADLRLMSDAHVQDIARRYMRLIQMAEDWLSALHSESLLTKRDKRVLKDSEK